MVFILFNIVCMVVLSLGMLYLLFEWVVIIKKVRKSYDVNFLVFCLCLFLSFFWGLIFKVFVVSWMFCKNDYFI